MVRRAVATRSVPRRAGASRPAPLRLRADLSADAELARSVGYMLRRAQLAVFADLMAKLEEPVRRLAQFTVLYLVGAEPGLTQQKVCDALGVQRSNLAVLLHELESQGLVQRVSTPADKRTRRLFLTPAGMEAVRRARAIQRRQEAKIETLLGTHDRDALLGMLRKLEALAPPGAGHDPDV